MSARASDRPMSPTALYRPRTLVRAVARGLRRRQANALVTLVAADVGGSDAVRIYRVDGPDRFTLTADLGAFDVAHPPSTDRRSL
jgi:hypothetical protein